MVVSLLDGNLNTAERAEDKIGLKVSSIFPAITPQLKGIDFNFLQHKAVTAISRRIILNQFKSETTKMPVVNMFLCACGAKNSS